MIWEKSSSLNCQEDNITSLENVHRWIVLSLAIVVPGQNVHRWIVVMCTFPRKHVHRWTYETKVVTSLGKNVQRWMWDAYGHMATETCSSLNLWDQSCHLARQKCSTLNVRCIWTYGHRNMFIAEPMRPKLSPRALGKNVQRWMWDAYGHMTETCSSLNLWDQNCHLATQKNSTLNGIVICIWQLQRHFAWQNRGRNCTKSCLHRVQLRGL